MIHQSSAQYFNKRKKFLFVLGAAKNILLGKPQVFNLNVNCTNACNQHCAMCNAALESRNPIFLSAQKYKDYLEQLQPYQPATVTLSGGEPTLTPELPEIIDLSVKYFCFGVGINSNFYAGNKRFQDNMIAALKANIRISCSFDAFGEAADRQRGATDVAHRTIENMKWVAAKKKELHSQSTLITHTVMSDITLDHVEHIFELSKQLGYEQRIAPAINFYYQSKDANAPGLQATPKLKTLLEHALYKRGLRQNVTFVKGMMVYAQKKAPKLCPYLTWPFKTHKIFLDPNGDISLCDRTPLGNLKHLAFHEMLKTPLYQQKIKEYHQCPGCWIGCFVEPMLAISPKYKKQIHQLWDEVIRKSY